MEKTYNDDKPPFVLTLHSPWVAYITAAAVVLALFVVNPWPSQVLAVNNSQLWLPRNYNRYFKHLQKAARVAEEAQRCHTVIAGTVSQTHSSKDNPVFKITCRDSDRKTFVYLIDGLSYKFHNQASTGTEDLEQQSLNKRLDDLWMICSAQLQKRTQNLGGVTWLSSEKGGEGRPDAVINGDDDILFEVLFNTSGGTGDLLRYRALCHFKTGVKNINIYAYLEEADGE